jgi:hypothetical protein
VAETAVCARCRRPFAETRRSSKWLKAHPDRATEPEDKHDVREGRCEVHGWQQFVQ